MALVQTRLAGDARLKLESWLQTTNSTTYSQFLLWIKSRPLLLHSSENARVKLRSMKQNGSNVEAYYYECLKVNNDIISYDLKDIDSQYCFLNGLDSNLRAAAILQARLLSKLLALGNDKWIRC